MSMESLIATSEGMSEMMGASIFGEDAVTLVEADMNQGCLTSNEGLTGVYTQGELLKIIG